MAESTLKFSKAWVGIQARRLASIFNTSSGHDHDGVNSKLVAGAGAASVTPEMLTAAAKTRTHSYKVEDLAAGADINGRIVFGVPAAQSYTLTKAYIVGDENSAGIDAGNTCVVALKDGDGNTIVTKTYDNVTTFPAANTVDDLGALDVAHKILPASDTVELEITNGATADPPVLSLVLEYTEATA